MNYKWIRQIIFSVAYLLFSSVFVSAKEQAVNTWEEIAQAPYNIKGGASLIYYQNSLFISLGGGSTSYFWKLDLNTNVWQELRSFPDDIGHGADMTFDGDGYIYATKGTSWAGLIGSKAFWRYDILTGQWQILPDAPENVGTNGSIVFAEGYIYLRPGDSFGNGFYRYDTTNSTWQTLTSGPILALAAGVPAEMTYDNSQYIYTFQGGENINGILYDDIWRYNIQNDQWLELGHNEQLERADLVYVSNQLYILNEYSVYNFESFDLSTNTWSRKENLPSGWWGGSVGYGASLVYDGYAYIYALEGSGQNPIWRYCVPSTSAPLDLSISSSDISFNPSGAVAPGTQVDITATIHNDGDADATCDVSIFYEYDVETYVTIDDFTGVSVAAGETEDVQAIWDTTGLETTTYPVYVYIYNTDPDEEDTSNNIAHSDYALPVELLAFSTERQDDGTVLIRWQTASETLNKGWNIWRRHVYSKDAWEKINENLIAGAGTAPFGEDYEFVDVTVSLQEQYLYYLEWISTTGKAKHSKELLIDGQIGNFVTPMAEENTIDTESRSAYIPAKEAETDWLNVDNSADYVIIVPDALKHAVKPLAEFRGRQGYRVKVVSIEDIYALFPDNVDERAIHRFLTFAYNNWQPPKLRYVLLVGDAVIGPDGKQFITKTLLPTFVRKMSGVGQIATDYPYACIVGDDSVPELAVGRIPVRSVPGASSVVRKIIRNETSSFANSKVVFVNGDYEYPGEEYAETSSESLISEFCEGNFDVTRIYTMPQDESLKKYQGDSNDLIAVFNEGPSWLEYRGHGGAYLWSSLLDANGAGGLHTDGQLPIVISVSCFTGSFTDSKNRLSIAEALLRNPAGGAVTYIGNTGHGMIFTGHDFSKELWGQIVNNGKMTIGEAVFNAKKNLAERNGDKGFLHSINLFGDPATRIRLE